MKTGLFSMKPDDKPCEAKVGRRCPQRTALANAALLLLGLIGSTQAQISSPVGTWDCVISGAKNGVAYLTFSNETNGGGTFYARMIAVPKARRSSSASLIPAMVAGLGSNGLGPRRPDEPRGT